jgi:imidazolonepropionase-like amidohydrolase
MVAAGRRADLLLVAGNPLDDLNHLRHPDGVMARGRWFSREELSAMLAALAQEP